MPYYDGSEEGGGPAGGYGGGGGGYVPIGPIINSISNIMSSSANAEAIREANRSIS